MMQYLKLFKIKYLKFVHVVYVGKTKKQTNLELILKSFGRFGEL